MKMNPGPYLQILWIIFLSPPSVTRLQLTFTGKNFCYVRTFLNILVLNNNIFFLKWVLLLQMFVVDVSNCSDTLMDPTEGCVGTIY